MRVPVLLGLALIAAPAPAWASEPAGFVLVRTSSGTTIELDDRLVGVVEDPGGMVLRDVAQGARRIRAWRAGHEDQNFVAHVEKGLVTTVDLRPWQPIVRPPATQGGKRLETGSVVVEVLDDSATLDARKLGWVKVPLPGRIFVGTHVPAGQHKLTFCNSDKCIDYRAQIPKGDVLSLVIDFEPGRVHDNTLAYKGRWTRARIECLRTRETSKCLAACNLDLAVMPLPMSEVCGGALAQGSGYDLAR